MAEIRKPESKSIDPTAPIEVDNPPSRLDSATVDDIAQRAVAQKFKNLSVSHVRELIEQSQNDAQNLTKGLASGELAAVVFHLISKITAVQIKAEDRLAALEKRSVPAYRGLWKAKTPYARGSFVTYGGSVWHSEEDANEDKPGSSDAWTLAVKRGRDGRHAARSSE